MVSSSHDPSPRLLKQSARLLSAKARDAEQESDPFAMQKLQSYVLLCGSQWMVALPFSACKEIECEIMREREREREHESHAEKEGLPLNTV